MNAFDFVITVSLGSTLATVILNKPISIWEGTFAFFMLVFLQFVVTWITALSSWFQKIIKTDPRLVYFNGSFLEKELLKERVSKEEVFAAV